MWGDVVKQVISLFPWRKLLLLLLLLQYISVFGESSLEVSWHTQDNFFGGYALEEDGCRDQVKVFQTFSRLLE